MTSPCLEQFGWFACGQRIETIKTEGRRKRKRRFRTLSPIRKGVGGRGKEDSVTLPPIRQEVGEGQKEIP